MVFRSIDWVLIIHWSRSSTCIRLWVVGLSNRSPHYTFIRLCVMWLKQNVQVTIPKRIVSILPGLNESTEGDNKRKPINITSSVFVRASTPSSRFRRCWLAYMSTKPSDEDLKSLFKIGHFHISNPTSKRLTVEMVQHRSSFVREVVRRGERTTDTDRHKFDDNVEVFIT